MSGSDGDFFIQPTPGYVSQYASRERVDEFLESPTSLAEDGRWAAAGFSTADEYAYWAPRACGAACLKMLLDVAGPQLSLAEVVRIGVSAGAYGDQGWIYDPMVQLLRERGLESRVFAHRSVDFVAREIAAQRCVIASVNPRVIRAEPVEGDVIPGGHLIVVIGYRLENGEVTGFFIHNPSGRTREHQERYFSNLGQFARAYAGRGISVALQPSVTLDGPS